MVLLLELWGIHGVTHSMRRSFVQFDMMEEVLHCVFSSGDISLNDGSHRLIATIFNIPLNSCFALLLFNYRQDLEMVYEIS